MCVRGNSRGVVGLPGLRGSRNCSGGVAVVVFFFFAGVRGREMFWIGVTCK